MKKQLQISERLDARLQNQLTNNQTILCSENTEMNKLIQASILLREAILKCNEIIDIEEMNLRVLKYQADSHRSPDLNMLHTIKKVTRDNKEVHSIQFAYSSTS